MRKMLIVIAAIAITCTSISSVQASGNGGFFAPRSNTRTYRTWRGGIFDRLLEMERRKNEIFFGGFRR
ncbi:MAG: hypothetical protein KDA93_08360 [Planctomycetaceae bacterium]|nr:hypothetical protein [Planctomycetaceae bacterium]